MQLERFIMQAVADLTRPHMGLFVDDATFRSGIDISIAQRFRTAHIDTDRFTTAGPVVKTI